MKKYLYSQQEVLVFRGSGEKQIELDRRLIANHVYKQKQLAKIVRQRQNQRKRRKNNEI